jgi:hypothetical protein
MMTHGLLREECEELARTIPAPSGAVRDREIQRLESDVDSFLRLLRDDPPEWIELEFAFGGEDRPFEIETSRGRVRFRGIIDRVDRLRDGSLRVVDYKTGGTFAYSQRHPFAGGRRIQHIIYVAAAERFIAGEVSHMEYHFPSVKGQNNVVRYAAEALREGELVLEHLVALATEGPFIATGTLDDCRFCDFREVCRVKEGDYGDEECLPVSRSKDWIEAGHPLVTGLAALREMK